MPLLRRTAISSFTRAATRSSIRQPRPFRQLSTTPNRFAQGYGDGEGDPKGENPQEQGSSNEIKHNSEHPGPAPPKEGQSSGAGPTKGSSSGKSPEEASAQSGGSRSKDAEETGSSPTGGSVGGGESGSSGEKSKGKSSPKISDKSVPGGGNSESKQAEVDQHNREFERGHDRAPKAEQDKVDKKFWQGQ